MAFFRWVSKLFRRNKINREWSSEEYGETDVALGKDALPLDSDELHRNS